MKKRFIESLGFTSRALRRLDDAQLSQLQRQLLEDPDAGAVIRGCGGLRKLRLADPHRQKGKRGGFRVIYLHLPELDWIYLLDIYDKDEKDDLDAQQKVALRQLVKQLKLEATKSVSPRKRRKE